MHNDDLSIRGGTPIDNQSITFSVDRKVIDTMKWLYQLSLKAAAIPGDPEDDGNDELDDESSSNSQGSKQSP